MKRFLFRLAAVLIPLLIIAALAAPRLGAWLVVEDPLQKADAIFVLGGTRFERPLEAADLYNEGWAPKIFLVRQIADWGELHLMARGIAYAREVDAQIDLLHRLGVPLSAIEILGEQNSTAAEAETLRLTVLRDKLLRVIVVTSKQHTRRAGLVMRRRLAGTGTAVVMRASRYDRANIARWWQDRSTLRFTLFEMQRYAGYWLGVAD